MTLDEAIKAETEKAGELRCDAEIYKYIGVEQEHIDKCENCAKEHEQLAEWLKDYKRLKETAQPIQVSMKDLTAEEKQHFFNVWKDVKLQIINEN